MFLKYILNIRLSKYWLSMHVHISNYLIYLYTLRWDLVGAWVAGVQMLDVPHSRVKKF